MTARTRYSTGAIVLHWLIALLVALNFAAAWVAESQPKEMAGVIMGNHKAIGISILALSLLRLVWRLMHPVPPMPAKYAGWEVKLAKVTHGLLYVMMIGMPLSGWMMASGRGPVNWFGVFDVPALPVNKALGGFGHEFHEIGAWVFIALLVLHVAGALKHQFQGEREIQRMWFSKG